MVTAELATALPVLLVLLGVALSAVAVADARVRCLDAAREAVRALARGDPSAARQLAEAAAPGVEISEASRGAASGRDDTVVVTAELPVHLLTSWLPTVIVSARAVAAAEPRDDGADDP